MDHIPNQYMHPGRRQAGVDIKLASWVQRSRQYWYRKKGIEESVGSKGKGI